MQRLTRAGTLGGLALVLVFLAVAAAAYRTPAPDTITAGIRIAGLWALFSLGLAALTTLFAGKSIRLFGRPFLSVHHALGAQGIAAIAFHALLVGVRASTPSVSPGGALAGPWFAPAAGLVALLLVAIAVAAALLRSGFAAWRHVHLAIYAALLLGFVHAALLSGFFCGDPFLALLFLLLGIAIAVAFVAGRRRRERGDRASPGPG